MANVSEQLMNLRSAVFGAADETATKTITIRMPLDTTAHVEAITDVSGKSRSAIMVEVLKLGLACFQENLSDDERVDIAEAYQRIKEELVIEMMESR